MDKYLELAKELTTFKTISTDSTFSDEIENCVKWYKDLFEVNGFDVEIVKGYSNPIILAEYDNGSKETALVYGHYDVQPAGDESDWRGEPFSILEHQGKLLARGIIDNKGQSLVHIVSVLKLIKEQKLKTNIKFIIEGGEEIGSPGVDRFLVDYKEKLDADFIIISDGLVVEDYPVVEVGFRGILDMTIEVITSDRELHSGMFGGAAPNSVHEAAKIIAKIYDEEGKILIDGIYDNVADPTRKERENNQAIPYSFAEFKNLSGTRQNISEPDTDFYTQTGLRPTVQVSGIEAGYYGEGYKSGIPNKTTFKLNIRLVDKQQPQELRDKVLNFLQNNTPEYVEIKLLHDDVKEGAVPGVKISPDNKYIRDAISILEEVYGKEVIKKYVGGTIPLVYHIENILKIPQVFVPFANPDCNMHAANENFTLSYLEKALEFSYKFFKK